MTLEIHFNEDAGEFNQIAINLAMICATSGRKVRLNAAPRGEFRNTGELPAQSR